MSSAPNLDTLLDASDHKHRRIVLAVLANQQQSLSIETLTNAILKYNHHLPRTEVDDETINRIHTDLYHVHLPKLAEAGVIQYDPERNVADLTAEAGREDSHPLPMLAMDPDMVFDRLEREHDLIRQRDELKRQNERLEEFASVISHDLWNPLNVAEGRLELAQNECDSDHLVDAANAVDRSLTLIEDLLTWAREGVEGDDIELVDLAETLNDCWQTVETADTTLVTETEQTIRADKSRLKQLFENLFRNAVEHAGEDVTVTVGEMDDGFFVADDGPGIPPDERDKVFNVGYSTAEGSTGFGLNIVQEIVEGHGWHIAVTDSETGGARFEIAGVEFVAE